MIAARALTDVKVVGGVGRAEEEARNKRAGTWVLDPLEGVKGESPPPSQRMGWLTGLEPATPWTTTRCSTD